MKPPSVKGKRKKKKDEEIACTEPTEERKEKKKKRSKVAAESNSGTRYVMLFTKNAIKNRVMKTKNTF